MLILQNVTYAHPDKDVLFEDLSFSVQPGEKLALIGANGAGKSTLLRLLAGALRPTSGVVKTDSKPYYVPQIFGQYNDCTVAQALRVEVKLKALHQILGGAMTDAALAALDDDWNIEERCAEALAHWGLDGLELTQSVAGLSGGEKTKVFLAGIAVHQPGIVLLDEPSNHLDAAGRGLLYDYIKSATATLVVVSHDRTLLNLMPAVVELSTRGLTHYGGSYAFYTEQKAIEADAFQQTLKSKEKALRKAKDVAREVAQRQQKQDARGKGKQAKAGLPTISMNTFRNRAENSTARVADIHAEKTAAIANEVAQLRKALPDADKMRLGLDASELHRGKILVETEAVNVHHNGRLLWTAPLSFQITSGERIAVRGRNGSGKTTLLKLVTGAMAPTEGTIHRADFTSIYVDQDYSLIRDDLTVYEQAQSFNTDGLHESEVKSRLTHFLFTHPYWDKPCSTLSGGEKMRLMLCCLTIGRHAPDLIVLDEPTNNLDIQNTDILTAAIADYQGTLLVVSHDGYFPEQVGVERELALG